MILSVLGVKLYLQLYKDQNYGLRYLIYLYVICFILSEILNLQIMEMAQLPLVPN